MQNGLVVENIKHAVHAWSHTGAYLPGWPVRTGNYVLSSPAIGDIDEDGSPEVVVGCNDGKLHAWNGDGTRVPGWPVLIRDDWGNTGPLNFASPVLANFDFDPCPEALIYTRGGSVVNWDSHQT